MSRTSRLLHRLGNPSVKASSTTDPIAKSGPIDPTNLASSLQLLDSLFVRNKNQHRNQLWWKPFSLLRNAVQKVMRLKRHESELQSLVPVKAAAPASAAQDFRHRFELEAQVRRDREVLCGWIRDVLCPRCYVVFSGIVADTQFANLGVVLMGVLSEIAGAVGLPQAPAAETDNREDVMQHAQGAANQARSLTAQSLHVTGPEKGTLVERVYDSDDLGEVIERQKDSPQRKGPTSEEQTGDGTRLLSLSTRAEADVVEEATSPRTAIKMWAMVDDQSHDDDVEMDESATVTALEQRKDSAAKDKEKVSLAMQEEQTKVLARSSQTAPGTNLPPLPSQSGNEHSPAASPRPRTKAATKSRAPNSTVGLEASKKHKKTSGQNNPSIPEKRAEHSSENRIESKSKGKKVKKKRNAIDDMFAGFG